MIGFPTLIRAQESPEIDALVDKLGASEKVEDFRAVEEWVFANDQGRESVTERMEQAFDLIDDLPKRSTYRNRDELVLKRYVNDYGKSWQVLAAAAKFQDKLS